MFIPETRIDIATLTLPKRQKGQKRSKNARSAVLLFINFEAIFTASNLRNSQPVEGLNFLNEAFFDLLFQA